MRPALPAFILGASLVACAAPTRRAPEFSTSTPRQDVDAGTVSIPEPTPALPDRPDLATCIKFALANHASGGIATADIEHAEAQLREAQSYRWPRLDLKSTALRMDEDPYFVTPGQPISFGRGTRSLADAAAIAEVINFGINPDSPLFRQAYLTALDMLGYAEEVILGLPIGRILPQDGLRDALIGAIAEGTAVRDFETSLVAGDGKLVPVRVTASMMSRVAYPDLACPQHAPDECECKGGVVEACVLVATDISELRRAEQIRTATYEVIDAGQAGGGRENLYATVDRALGQLMPIDTLLVAVHDERSDSISFPYFRCRRRTGLTPGESEGERGLTAYALARGGAVHLTRFEIFRLVEEGAVVLDGPAPAEWVGVPLVVGDRPIGLLAVQCDAEGDGYSPDDRDILTFFGDQVSTALQRQHATEDRARLSSAVEHAEDAIVITDAHGAIEYANPAFERLTGYHRGEVIGQTTTMLRDPDADAAKYNEMWTTVAGGEAWTGRVNYCRKDGTPYQADVAMSPVRDDAGEIVNYVTVQHDVTNEVALEEQLRHSQKMDAVGKLAGGVAHDFNNLLSVITGYSSMLSTSLGPDSEERDFVEEIAKSAERASRLTRQLLAFSRRQVLKPVSLDLNEVVNDMEKMLRRLIGEDVELATDLKSEIGAVEADPGQIEQVLMNLAVNARDAMPRGGRLTLATGRTELDADYCSRNPDVLPGKYVLLSMSDTGCGMDAATISRIFEPFFTTKGLGEGTGLGLSTVYGIVKQSGGHISVYSEIDEGTTFRVYLPTVEECAMDATQAIPQPSTRGSETILLVEDEDGVRKLAQLILERRGYSVIAACHGPDALEKSAEFDGEIPLLLTDVVMPHMSGRDVYELLSASRPGLKVLYMSGYTDSAIVHHGVLEAGTPFMEKPFMPETLARNVRDVLDMDTLVPLPA